MRNILSLFLFFIIFGCQSGAEQKGEESIAIEVLPVTFLDSIAASNVIIEDKQEGFFEMVGVTDMLIQMKRPYQGSLNRDSLLVDYRAFLKTEVLDFTEEEVLFCKNVFSEIIPQLEELHIDIFPKNLQLIKLKGNHYGSGAFYTREKTILIPKEILKEKQYGSFYETMLHEIFHIYSRYHPERRKALYELIGFKKLEESNVLSMDASLKNKLLLNPDGIDGNYFIELKEDGKSLFAVPILVANSLGFEKNKSEFFDYLQFNLYPIQSPFESSIKVFSQDDGTSRINLDEVEGFYEQIQRNTNYIIHPDEILADNFIFLVQAKKDPRTLGQFSEEGIKLIEEMEKIINVN